MTAYSVVANLLRPTNEGVAIVQVRQPVLLPRTAADELPPYREQPWIIDKCGYRKIDRSDACSGEQAVASLAVWEWEMGDGKGVWGQRPGFQLGQTMVSEMTSQPKHSSLK